MYKSTYSGTVRFIFVAAILVSIIVFVSAKNVPDKQNEQSTESVENDADFDYRDSTNGKLRSRPTSSSSDLFSGGPQKRWKCAMKGEKCGKVDGKWRNCCRSYTACVGNEHDEMVCEH